LPIFAIRGRIGNNPISLIYFVRSSLAPFWKPPIGSLASATPTIPLYCFSCFHFLTSTCSGAIPDPAEKLSRKKEKRWENGSEKSGKVKGSWG